MVEAMSIHVNSQKMRFILLSLMLIIISLTHFTKTVEGQNYLSVIATSTQCPRSVSVYSDPSTGVVYAACAGGGVISISSSTVTTLANSTHCPNPASVYSDPSTGVVYAACYDGRVISISSSTVTTLANSTQCPNPASEYSDPSTGVVYAAFTVEV